MDQNDDLGLNDMSCNVISRIACITLKKKFKGIVGAKYAVANTSCNTALELVLRVIEGRRADEVIMPEFTHPPRKCCQVNLCKNSIG
jgi:dTDP-4-amino-4,6-dideoxygalactose transaminase